MKSSILQVVATAIDADGCLFNPGYTQNWRVKNRLIDYNQALIKFLHSCYSADPYALNLLLPGSFRQSHYLDCHNSEINKSASFFLELETFHAHLKLRNKSLKLSKYLLADLKSGKPEGYAFEKARGRIKDSEEHPSSIGDQSKIALLYLQMHKLASENPEAIVDYHFIDDRTDILLKLETFYKVYPELMPFNLRLQLHEYSGIKVKSHSSILGRGPIDKGYEEGFLEMVSNASSARVNPGDPIYLGYNQIISFFSLSEFKLMRGLDYSPTLTAADLQSIASIINERGEILPLLSTAPKNQWQMPPLNPLYFSLYKKPSKELEENKEDTCTSFLSRGPQ